jgi:hypothetical protein
MPNHTTDKPILGGFFGGINLYCLSKFLIPFLPPKSPLNQLKNHGNTYLIFSVHYKQHWYLKKLTVATSKSSLIEFAE